MGRAAGSPLPPLRIGFGGRRQVEGGGVGGDGVGAEGAALGVEQDAFLRVGVAELQAVVNVIRRVCVAALLLPGHPFQPVEGGQRFDPGPARAVTAVDHLHYIFMPGDNPHHARPQPLQAGWR